MDTPAFRKKKSDKQQEKYDRNGKFNNKSIRIRQDQQGKQKKEPTQKEKETLR